MLRVRTEPGPAGAGEGWGRTGPRVGLQNVQQGAARAVQGQVTPAWRRAHAASPSHLPCVSGAVPATVIGCHCQRLMLGTSRKSSCTGQPFMACGWGGQLSAAKSAQQQPRHQRLSARHRGSAPARVARPPTHPCNHIPQPACLRGAQLHRAHASLVVDGRCRDQGGVGELARSEGQVRSVEQQACMSSNVRVGQ